MELATCIEALLFATDQPLGLARLAEVLPDTTRADLEAALAQLEQQYAAPERAFRVLRVAGGCQLATKPEFAELIRRLYTGKRRVRLTKAALETLAIVAYKQPTTRPEIDAIRGVASGGVLETLLERNLVQIAGRSEGVGRPLLYTTTAEFLQYLGLDRIQDLPSLEELEAMLAEREAAARQAEDEEMRALAEQARAADAPAELDEPRAEDEGATPAAQLAAARIEERRREQQLPSLDELDVELQERSARVGELAKRVAAERKRHAAELAPTVESELLANTGATPGESGSETPRLEAAPPCPAAGAASEAQDTEQAGTS